MCRFVFFFFWQYLGLNSGPHAYYAGILIIWATLPALFFVVGIFEMGSLELFGQAGFENLNPPDLSLLSS
jgi:hypothetical protein